MRKFDDALRDLDAAQYLDGENPEVYIFRSKIYAQVGLTIQIDAQMLHAASLAPNHEEVCQSLYFIVLVVSSWCD